MTFLNPFALFGLLAAALPLLLHLLNLRKLRTVEFSTLAFLKELQKTRIRRLKLRQILLLILRTLLVLFIVFAFARPTLRGSVAGTIGSHARTSAVFIIDDSYSMTMSNERGELLKQAKQAAENLNHLFAEGDEVHLVTLSTLSHTATGRSFPTRDFVQLRNSIEEIGPSAIRRSLEEGLRVASKLLAASNNFNKEVYVFSDFQQGVVAETPEETAAKENLFPPEIRFFFVPFNKRNIQNFGIESIAIPSSIFERNKPFIVQAEIGNFTDNDVQDHVVSVYLNGTRVAERSVDLPKRSSTRVEFSVTPGAVGYVQGFVELEDDDFQYDNRRYFTLQIPDQIRVLCVGLAQDVQYPSLALTTRTSEAESALALTETTPDHLNSTMMRRADVILLCTSRGFSSSQLSELQSFVNDGGGLAVFPSSLVDATSFNAQFGGALHLPLCVGIDRSSAPQSEAGSYTEFDKVELRHPLFEGMFESPTAHSPQRSSSVAQRKVESPRIRSYARFGLTAQTTPIITLTSGGPFLIECSTGSGRILLFAVPTTTEWSDFPLKGLFVPLMHRTALYLGHQQSRGEDVAPGSEVVIRSSSATSDLWTIHTPQNLELTATPSRQSIQRVVRFTATDQLGLYEVSAKAIPFRQFVVNLDPRESLLAPAADAETNNLFGRIGIATSAVRTIDHPEDLERRVMELRFGLELWKYLLLLALTVAIIELFVERTSQREIGIGQHHD